MVYAQYAVMGGFAADIQHIHNAITKRVTITTNGILFLARHGCFCRIKKDDIQDTSKEPEERIVVNPETRLEIGSSLESTSWDPAQKGIQISTLYRYKGEDVNGIPHYYAIGTSPHNAPGYVPVSNMGICKMVSGQASSLGYGPEIQGWFGFGSDRSI